MANNTRRNVYLIRQDVEHLGGDYFDRAIVIATGPERAVKDLLRHVRTHHPSAIARRSRLRVIRIGENAPERIEQLEPENDDPTALILAVVLGNDDHIERRTLKSKTHEGHCGQRPSDPPPRTIRRIDNPTEGGIPHHVPHRNDPDARPRRSRRGRRLQAA